MANKKNENKTTATKKSVKKVTQVEKVKSNEVDVLRQQMAEMQTAMKALMEANQSMKAFIDASQMMNTTEKVLVKQEESEVVIGCRVINGLGWGDRSDVTGEIRLNYNEEQSVTVSDMKVFFRQAGIRKLFEDGLCYFANKEDYLIFKIKDYVDLSDEYLIEILDKADTNEIIRDLNKITDNKKNGNVVNCVIYRICDMIRKGTLDWGYYTRKGVEEYFGMDFDRGITTLNMLDKYKN